MSNDNTTDAPSGLRDEACCALRIPSKERGCQGKAKLGRRYKHEANKLSAKWKKRYGVYRCPHCGDAHLTTKFRKSAEYQNEMLYTTPKSILHNKEL
jgi:hypothetical protein